MTTSGWCSTLNEAAGGRAPDERAEVSSGRGCFQGTVAQPSRMPKAIDVPIARACRSIETARGKPQHGLVPNQRRRLDQRRCHSAGHQPCRDCAGSWADCGRDPSAGCRFWWAFRSSRAPRALARLTASSPRSVSGRPCLAESILLGLRSCPSVINRKAPVSS